jgi:hypothetical protein
VELHLPLPLANVNLTPPRSSCFDDQLTPQYTTWFFLHRLPGPAARVDGNRFVGEQDHERVVLVDHGSTSRFTTRRWPSQEQLASAILEGIEAWYNPRRHTGLRMLSPHEYETLHTATLTAA